MSHTLYSFAPVTAADLPVIRGWLEQPHVREWWGEPEVELGYIRDMMEGRDTTRPFIFSIDGKQAGYIQYWFIGDHQNGPWIADNPWLAELPADAIGVDLSIGDPGMLTQGHGSAVLRTFAVELVRQGYGTIIIDPDPANLRAVRAYEKAGFRPITHLLGRTGNTHIMQYDLKESGACP